MSLIYSLNQLIHDASDYIEQISTGEQVSVEVNLKYENEVATLQINDGITVQNGSHSPDARILMNKTVFNKILTGKLTSVH